jgi:hypothetical protein
VQTIRCDASDASFRIAAIVADGAVERAEQPVMSWCQQDDGSAGAKMLRSANELAVIIFDVLEYVNVQNRVE